MGVRQGIKIRGSVRADEKKEKMEALLRAVSSRDRDRLKRELDALSTSSQTESTKEFWRALAALVEEGEDDDETR